MPKGEVKGVAVVCSQCGKESEGRFCPACGAAMPVPAGEGVEQAASGPVGAPSAAMTTPANTTSAGAAPSRAERRVPLWAILSAVAVVVALGVILVAVLSGGNDEDPVAQEAQPAGEVVDPHAICTDQLTAIVVNLVNGHYEAEIKVNGQQDPFYEAATHMVGDASQDRYRIGDTAALNTLHTNAGPVCTQVLKDAVRPNYPIDGTSP